MILSIKVKPSSSKSEFDALTNIAHLKASPEKNKANIELIRLLAKHFKISSSQIKILRGLTSKEKTIEIE